MFDKNQSINLSKGGSVNLSKVAPALKRVRVGLGWNPNTGSGPAYDLDVSAFILKRNINGDPTTLSPQHFVFFNNLSSPEGAVIHNGDNRDGLAEGDDEVMLVDLAKIPSEAAEISFIVTIHDAISRKQNFGHVKNSYIVIYDADTDVEICRYNLQENFSSEISVQFGSLERNQKNEFSFSAVGVGYSNTLADFVSQYGLTSHGG